MTSQRIRSARSLPWSTALPAAVLAVTVATIHVLDQGGITAYSGPPWWIGWGYRAAEVGGVLIALGLLIRKDFWLPWVAAMMLGFGPPVAYLLTRGPGLPGDPGDKGAWNDPLGTTSLLVEGTLFLMAVLVLVSYFRRDAELIDSLPPVGVGAPQEVRQA